jgi:hypothetical protein
MDAIDLNEIRLDEGILNDNTQTNTSSTNQPQTPAPVLHFKRDLVMRDMHKAYMGFLGSAVANLTFRSRRSHTIELAADDSTAYIISTGKWGCGAFGGHEVLKFLQQVVAAYLCCGPSSSSVTLPFSSKQSSSGQLQKHAESSDDDDIPYVCLRFSAYRDPKLQATLEQVYQACHGLTPRKILSEVLIEESHATTLFTGEDGIMRLQVDKLISLLRNIER